MILVDGREVALFNVEGRFLAVANRCPHRGGPLSRGHLETVNRDDPGTVPIPAVRCPLHGWLFDLTSGRCLNQPTASTTAYQVNCRGGTFHLKAIPPV